MGETVRASIRALLESTLETVESLLALPDEELQQPSSHVCAQGKDLWALLTNDIDHETIHAGQILEARYEAGITASPRERLAAEWLAARAKLIATFIGMSDAEFEQEMRPGGWTYRQAASHVRKLERHSLQIMRDDIAARGVEI
ncbi:MAG: hypothetical protein M0R74_04205 [Dehalococcoidia bacterium]|nr:hypothetical protein [Dehalococcoidia bacterium]